MQNNDIINVTISNLLNGEEIVLTCVSIPTITGKVRFNFTGMKVLGSTNTYVDIENPTLGDEYVFAIRRSSNKNYVISSKL